MPETQMLAVHVEKGVTVVEFTNNKILDESVLEEIKASLARLVEAAAVPKLLLDFSNVDFMSSAALGMLINVNKAIKEKNGQLRLAGIHPRIYEAFETTKLNRVFRMVPTRAEAMESYQ